MENLTADHDVILGNHTTASTETILPAWVEIPLLWIITVVSMVTNSMVLIILMKKPKMRTVSNLLVANLTIIDLSLCVCTLPFVTVAVVVNDWLFGDVFCRVLAFFQFWCLCALLWTLLLIAVNRFYMIVHAQTYAVKFTKQRATRTIYVLWVVSMVTALPPLFGWGEYSYDRGKSMCYLDIYGVSYIAFYVALSTLIPFVLMIYCYWNVFLTVRQNSRRIKNTAKALIQTSALVIAEGTGSPNFSRDVKRDFLPRLSDGGHLPSLGIPRNAELRRLSTTSMTSVVSRATLLHPSSERSEQMKLTRMLGMVFFLYTFLWMPVVLILLIEASTATELNKNIDKISVFLIYLQTCCNPLVYGLINESFRKVFCEVLCCKRKKSSVKAKRGVSVTVIGGDVQPSSAVLSIDNGVIGGGTDVAIASMYDDKDSAFSMNTASNTDATKIGSYVEVRPLYSDLSSDSVESSHGNSATDKARLSQQLPIAWSSIDRDGSDPNHKI